MKSMKIYQDLILTSKERYTTPIQVPPFSINLPAPGVETPVWSPPYKLMITNIAVMGAQFESDPGGSTTVSVRKWNDLTPYDEPIEVYELSLDSDSKRTSVDLLTSYTTDLSLSPQDNLYCSITAGSAHAHLTVQVYAARNDGVQ